MSMEPFDYLTYKRNKQQNKTPVKPKKDKVVVSVVCSATFILFFVLVMGFIGSKSSKIDIEYGRLGENTISPSDIEEQPTEAREKYTIDKRLFIIQQEEKGPSESRVVEPVKEHTEVISKAQFDIIKINNDEVVQKAEKEALKLQPKEEPQAPQAQEKPVGQPGGEAGAAVGNKVAIKPKLPVKPVIKPMSALDAQIPPSKVLIGKYSTIEEARKIQNSVTGLPDGVIPFVKKINNYYSVQIGSYESFDIAKIIAGKLKAKGYDVWILQ